MANKAFRTEAGGDGTIVLECKTCGTQLRAFKKGASMMRYTCHNCHGHRFRRLGE